MRPLFAVFVLTFALIPIGSFIDLFKFVYPQFEPKKSFVMSQTMDSASVQNLIQQALSNHKEGKTAEAIDYYERAIPLLSGNIKASLCGNVGALYMALGEYEKARDHFQNAVDADQSNPSAHFNLAVVLTTKLNQHAKAIKHCGISINLDKNNYKSLHLMGNIMQAIGRPVESTKYFVEAENVALALKSAENGENSYADEKEKSSSDGVLSKLAPYKAKIGDTRTELVDDVEYTLTCISQTPLVFVIDSLVSDKECNHIVNRASSALEKSYVMGGDGAADGSGEGPKVCRSSSGAAEGCEEEAGADTDTDADANLYRSSYNAWLARDATLDALQRRLSRLLDLPLPYVQQNSEELQVVRYRRGGQFKVHQDSSAFNSRLVTALLYLNNLGGASAAAAVAEREPEELALEDNKAKHALQGETWFPFAMDSKASDNSGSSSSAMLPSPVSVDAAIASALQAYEAVIKAHQQQQSEAPLPVATNASTNTVETLPGLKVAPRQGSAVIFFNHLAGGDLDPRAVHAGLPVQRRADPGRGTNLSPNLFEEGSEKWVANYWIGYNPSML
jgi:hypothetical protein